jgi:hypothetical protein
MWGGWRLTGSQEGTHPVYQKRAPVGMRLPERSVQRRGTRVSRWSGPRAVGRVDIEGPRSAGPSNRLAPKGACGLERVRTFRCPGLTRDRRASRPRLWEGAAILAPISVVVKIPVSPPPVGHAPSFFLTSRRVGKTFAVQITGEGGFPGVLDVVAARRRATTRN